MTQNFDTFFKANERRIHFQIHHLGIHGDWYGEFYSKGIVALWQAYREFDSKKGNLGTYLNYRIRYRLIDLIRKKNRELERDKRFIEQRKIDLSNGARHRSSNTPLPDIPSITITDTTFWYSIRDQLSPNQWKWVQYFIIADMSIKEIMEIEDVSADAVKGWGQAVKRKLRNDTVRKALEDILEK